MTPRSPIATATAVALVLATLACGGAEQDVAVIDTSTAATATTPATAAPGADVAEGVVLGLGDIAANPDQYIGQTVTVVAEVEEVVSPMSFRLSDESLARLGGDQTMLVLSPQAAQLAPLEDQWLNDEVRVTGTLRRMTVVEVEQEIGWDLSPEIESEVEGMRPVLIAQRIERVTERD